MNQCTCILCYLGRTTFKDDIASLSDFNTKLDEYNISESPYTITKEEINEIKEYIQLRVKEKVHFNLLEEYFWEKAVIEMEKIKNGEG